MDKIQKLIELKKTTNNKELIKSLDAKIKALEENNTVEKWT